MATGEEIVETLMMRTRRSIPTVGLGVYKVEPGTVTKDSVLAALRVGYRHIDTASIYNNEADVGDAIGASGLDRSEVFVTTKVWNEDHGYDATLAAFDISLEQLGLEYVDLYLIHWPVPVLRLDTWRALERLTLDGRVRDIGVSNYMVPHLREILDHAAVVPSVNQIELTPYNYRSRLEILNLCRDNEIVVVSYSPLTKGRKLDDPVLAEVGAQYGKTPAQVLIRWVIDKGFGVLPKSVSAERIAENYDVFDFFLTEADMDRLDALDEGLATGWDPTGAP
jgi:diketogulonate reductase-like aldo/keto reductase